ncbi:cation diffusion facilitator family transporter [Oceanobacillus luteolus]|uniref:Cation diffusion facilitator family transporter n=1 Tax=Oceanobacillus luteolus TaxID=1274358 RepID=A0ABW4HRS3_9BACI|nr:cation diffusion facilitator family transporter [Oceanobacillus luteolus]MCM3739592.1 cation diffusion facilitator family transporter [Oceanobacillus luteolus]
MNHADNLRLAEKGAWLSIFTYLSLAIIKIIIANWGNSLALQADGLNNTTDVIASIAVLVGLRISQKPADENHRYGHYRAETIASLFAAFIMMFIGIQVIYDTIRNIIYFETAEPNILTAWTALGSAGVMLLVYLYNKRLSQKLNSQALFAVAQDNRSDALVSGGAFIGIIGAQFGLYWLDPLTGTIVGIIICKTAFDIFRDATLTLTDAFDEEELSLIKESVEEVSGVEEVVDLKGRVHGSQALLELTILVDAELTVEDSHRITEWIEKEIGKKHGVTHAHIHIEPYFRS